jgi:hypothetical protein
MKQGRPKQLKGRAGMAGKPAKAMANKAQQGRSMPGGVPAKSSPAGGGRKKSASY